MTPHNEPPREKPKEKPEEKPAEKPEDSTDTIVALLEKLFPFRFLYEATRQSLAEKCERMQFAAGDRLIESGDAADRRVFLVATGALDVIAPGRGRVNGIEAPGYVGEWEPLFDVPRVMEIRARTDAVVYAMSEEQFLDVVATSRSFALSLRTILRDRQGIFSAFDRFRAELQRGVGLGHINIESIIPFYRDLRPALHPLCGIGDRIDFHALGYAVRRLPANVTRTFAFLLVDELPQAFRSPDELFEPVLSDARRRDIWEVLPGKDLVLLRHGMSDLTDFVTCLCLYAVEAQKIRRRVLERQTTGDAADSVGLDTAEQAFDESERDKLAGVWGNSYTARLFEVARHREMFSVDVRRHTGGYDQRRSEKWADQIASATRRLTNHGPASLPPETRVHIVSSNTHSVTNCLNPWWVNNGGEILAWAKSVDHPFLRRQWSNPSDQVYAIGRDYFRALPDKLAEVKKAAEAHGILTLSETTSTGIQVQLIDVGESCCGNIDPGIKTTRSPDGRSGVPDGRSDVIVNIDYAFGEQAEDIIRNLNMLFGRRIASINFFGKAGALTADRGDVLMPSAFIQQSTDLFQPIAPPPAFPNDLAEDLAPANIHMGPMLTVDGTLLQNREMLGFYRHLWEVAGIEMEGFHYHRQILESKSLGVIPEDVELRFFYYVSDRPLDADRSLASRLKADEGIPPLYAITRHILNSILA
mgnify:CR=1 FL=1